MVCNFAADHLQAYSSGDPATIADHMRQLRRSGCGVAVMSWYPAGQVRGLQQSYGASFSTILTQSSLYFDLRIGQADDNGGTAKGANPEFDRLMFPVLDAALQQGLQLAVHIEPYEGRSHMSVRRDLQYITKRSAAKLICTVD